MAKPAPAPAPTPNRFPDQNELKRFARSFVTERINALQKDVTHCLQPPYAPMPAILYCIAAVDLMGALLSGQASKKDPLTGANVNTTKNSKEYMQSFMGYTDEQSDLILEIFRHKLVHLAQPRTFYSYNNKIVVWQYDHQNTPNHLILQDLPSPETVLIKSGWPITIEQVFTLGITQFMQDIKDSVLRHGGYLDKLETDPNILMKFRKAIEETYAL
jgi:hypothetical protein